jgi:hypothetical protein
MGADLYDPQCVEALADHPLPTSALDLQGRSGVKLGTTEPEERRS